MFLPGSQDPESEYILTHDITRTSWTLIIPNQGVNVSVGLLNCFSITIIQATRYNFGFEVLNNKIATILLILGFFCKSTKSTVSTPAGL